MDNKKTTRQLLTELAPGQSIILCDPKQPGRVITQAVRVDDTYYLTGPRFSDCAPVVFSAYEVTLLAGMPGPAPLVELPLILEVARDHHDTEANAVFLLNKFLGDHGVPADGLVFTCRSLDDMLETAAGLYAAHSITWQR